MSETSNPTPSSSVTPALVAGIPGAAGAVAATCGTACAGACAPPLLGLLGLSGSSAALGAVGGWLRPVLFAVSMVALGLAFRRAYRRAPSSTGAARGSGRFRDSRGFVWLMALVCLALFGLPYLSQAAPTGDDPPCDVPCPGQPPCPR